jgi:CrcB protein
VLPAGRVADRRTLKPRLVGRSIEGENMERVHPVVLVAAGGALGSVARFAVANAFTRRLGAGWPFGTLVINLTGCFLIALFLTAVSERYPGVNPGWRYLFPTGFIGAYTTFSTYGFEVHRLVESGQVAGAIGYVVVSNVLGFAAILLGTFIARRM